MTQQSTSTPQKLTYCSIISELLLRDPRGNIIPVFQAQLVLNHQSNAVSSCYLNFEVEPECYQKIDIDQLFNLKSEIRGNFIGEKFSPHSNIAIAASLRSDLVPRLAEYINDINGASEYLVNLIQAQPDEPLISTESWLALAVQQQQETEKLGYRTLWSYLEPLTTSLEQLQEEELLEAMLNFLRENTDVSSMTQEVTEDTIKLFFKEISSLLKDEETPSNQENLERKGLFETAVNFFVENEWIIYLIKGKPVFYTNFKGNSGEWRCCGQVNEAQQQFIFYSLSPMNVPDYKRGVMAEFLTRANYGLVVGNFEMDLDNGQVLYKTAIDVEGDRLSSALIKQLVVANLATMDKYLPGIFHLLYNEVSPSEAIARIEL